MVQFQGLACGSLNDGSSFLLVDSNIDCNSKEYAFFRTIDMLLIVIYQGLPLLWFVILYRSRRRLNPPRGIGKSSLISVNKKRAIDTQLASTFFLWGDYLPECFHHEVIRRWSLLACN
jgi:hypothetical protein